MKPVRVPETNVTLTLPGGSSENDLPAQRAMLYNRNNGQTEQDAVLGFVTTWLPTEREARKLEAGACIELTVWGHGHPAVSLGVTDAVLPERELIDRGHVNRALGYLYSALHDQIARVLPALDADGIRAELLPDTEAFADLWSEAVDKTRDGAPQPTTTPEDETATPIDHAALTDAAQEALREQVDSAFQDIHPDDPSDPLE